MWSVCVEGALPGHVALLSHTEHPSDFWKAEGEMCKANHAAGRSYALCEITELKEQHVPDQHSLHRLKSGGDHLSKAPLLIS